VITKVWYSVGNGGDGSAYPRFMESEELATLDQDYMTEGWGETCTGYLEIEHDGPIFLKDVVTAEEIRDDLLEDLKYYSGYQLDNIKEHLEKVLLLIEEKNA
jgi:hypothetical protein